MIKCNVSGLCHLTPQHFSLQALSATFPQVQRPTMTTDQPLVHTITKTHHFETAI